MTSLLAFVLTTAAVYLLLSLVLACWPFNTSAPLPLSVPAQELERFVASGHFAEPAAARFFPARDGQQRLYRWYPGRGQDLLVLLHGSSSDSRYLAGLAQALSCAPAGPSVATLDMRGHGPEPPHRGDLDHALQQEQDIADLWRALAEENTFARFLLGGHSMGGGLALRYACGSETPRPDGLVLAAPFVHRKSPAARPGSGGWAHPCVPRFAGIQMLRRLGIRWFDHQPVLRFAVPPSILDGTETPVYSWQMFRSMTLGDDWRHRIAQLRTPVLVLGAEHDSIFCSQGYRQVFDHPQRDTVEIIPGINHFQLVASPAVPAAILAWQADVLPGQ